MLFTFEELGGSIFIYGIKVIAVYPSYRTSPLPSELVLIIHFASLVSPRDYATPPWQVRDQVLSGLGASSNLIGVSNFNLALAIPERSLLLCRYVLDPHLSHVILLEC